MRQLNSLCISAGPATRARWDLNDFSQLLISPYIHSYAAKQRCMASSADGGGSNSAAALACAFTTLPGMDVHALLLGGGVELLDLVLQINGFHGCACMRLF